MIKAKLTGPVHSVKHANNVSPFPIADGPLTRIVETAGHCLRILVFVLMLTATSTSYAAFIVAIDLDPGQSGVQTTRQVFAGESFDVGVVFELTNGTSLGIYEMSVEYDGALLDFNPSASKEEDTRGFSSLRFPGFDPVEDTDSGPALVGNIDGASILGTSDPGEFSVAILNFTAHGPVTPGDTVTSLLTPGFFKPGDVAFDASIPNGNQLFEGPGGVEFNPSMLTLKTTAVPEPSSLTLLSMVSLPWLFLRKRRSGVCCGVKARNN